MPWGGLVALPPLASPAMHPQIGGLYAEVVPASALPRLSTRTIARFLRHEQLLGAQLLLPCSGRRKARIDVYIAVLRPSKPFEALRRQIRSGLQLGDRPDRWLANAAPQASLSWAENLMRPSRYSNPPRFGELR